MSDVREDLEYLSKEYEDGDYVDISAQNYFQDALDEIERLRARVGVDAGVIAGLRNPPPCKWQLDPIDCVYETGCGESWVFPDGNAEENGVKFCPGCGHPVELTVTEVEDE